MPLVRTPMITPTKQYESIPALTPEEAGRLVSEAIGGRPRRVAPPVKAAAPPAGVAADLTGAETVASGRARTEYADAIV
mgnify:CR=1 FL=1